MRQPINAAGNLRIICTILVISSVSPLYDRQKMKEEVIIIVISGIFGALIAELRNFYARKRSRIESAVTKYVTKVSEFADEAPMRLEVMARSGVIRLNGKEFRRFTDRVVEEGCMHPYTNSVIDGIPESEIPSFLRRANEDGLVLADQCEVFRYISMHLGEPTDSSARFTAQPNQSL